MLFFPPPKTTPPMDRNDCQFGGPVPLRNPDIPSDRQW